MGFLDDLLGGLAGQSMGGGRMQQQQPMQAGCGGTSQVLLALLPVVLGMLANRGSQGGAQADERRSAGRRRSRRPARAGAGRHGEVGAERVASAGCSRRCSRRASAIRPTPG
jgi:hypothetical protein